MGGKNNAEEWADVFFGKTMEFKGVPFHDRIEGPFTAGR
jgi:hypothetical protein